jgi:hypothetical protein
MALRGRPLCDAVVRLPAINRSTRTGRHGEFNFETIPPSNLGQLRVEAKGRELAIDLSTVAAPSPTGDSFRDGEIWPSMAALSDKAVPAVIPTSELREQGGGQTAGVSAPGPALVLTRGEPIAIRVANRLSEPTSVHWHGIELQSYYDGVAGWTGHQKQVTPMIQPGKSFTVYFNPPRAGTFIYHTPMMTCRSSAPAFMELLSCCHRAKFSAGNRQDIPDESKFKVRGWRVPAKRHEQGGTCAMAPSYQQGRR